FSDRCALATARCREEEPPPYAVGERHSSRCHYHEQAQSLPRREVADLDLPRVDRSAAPLVRFDGLGKTFQQHGHAIRALADVSAAVWPGETLGLVGESGSGKTTLARTLLGVVEPTDGTVELEGRRLAPKLGRRAAADVRGLQIVFQN